MGQPAEVNPNPFGAFLFSGPQQNWTNPKITETQITTEHAGPPNKKNSKNKKHTTTDNSTENCPEKKRGKPGRSPEGPGGPVHRSIRAKAPPAGAPEAALPAVVVLRGAADPEVVVDGA